MVKILSTLRLAGQLGCHLGLVAAVYACPAARPAIVRSRMKAASYSAISAKMRKRASVRGGGRHDIGSIGAAGCGPTAARSPRRPQELLPLPPAHRPLAAPSAPGPATRPPSAAGPAPGRAREIRRGQPSGSPVMAGWQWRAPGLTG